MQIAKHYAFETITDLQPTTGGSAMPFGSAFMSPGVYTLGGQSWDCTQPGLYRFKLANEAFFRNRLIWGNDLYAIVSAVCWNTIQGTGHETPISGIQAISDLGRYFVWRMRCGYIGNFMAWLLPQYGYSVRQVGVISAPGNRNGYDDGHQVLEVSHGGKWVMFDMTNGCYWKNASGVHLSTSEFIAHIANGAPMPQKYLLDGNQRRWNHDSVPSGTLDMGLYGDLCVDGIETAEGWMRRVFYQLNV